MRLRQGDFDRETAYEIDPVDQAKRFAAAGARRLHIVDLDAARGTADNRTAVEGMVLRSGIEVQVAGGVRSMEDASRWLDAGAAFVVMGTVAVREPERLARIAAALPGRVLAALDVSHGRPAVTGWSATEHITIEETLSHWAETLLAGVVVTSVDRDGTLAGPALDLLATARVASAHPLTYSGGIATLEDVRAVGAAGAAGIILGRSLLEDRIELAEALALSS